MSNPSAVLYGPGDVRIEDRPVPEPGPAEVQVAVNVDSIGRRYTPGSTELSPDFRPLVASLVRKVHQESLDGAAK